MITMDTDPKSDRTGIATEVLSNIAAATVAIVAGPAVGIAAAGAAPVMSASLRGAIGHWNNYRYQRVQRTLVQASARAQMTADDLVELLASDPDSLDLLVEALDAAARTHLDLKIAALAETLSRASTSDRSDAVIGRERLRVSIFRDLEAGHLAVLQFLSKDSERPGHLRLERRARLDQVPGATPIDHTLAVLSRHALVREVAADEIATWGDAQGTMAHAGLTPRGRGPDHVAWMLTSLGSECLRELTASRDAS